MNLAKSARPRPTCLNQDGGLLSNFQISVEPSAAIASMRMSMCGLTHSTLVRVPFKVNGFDMSKTAEGEWCAESDPARTRPARTRDAAKNLGINKNPPLACRMLPP